MDRRVIEGIEACRPASDDLKRRDLADVAHAVEFDAEAQVQYQRVQAWDAAISGAMDQVDVPPGLAERILSRLPSTAATSASVAADAVSIGESAESIRFPGARRWKNVRLPRRQLLVAAASVAAVLLVSLLARDWLSPRGEASLDERADRWLVELARDTGSWRAMDAALRDFPVSDAVIALPSGWRPINSARGVAYQLRNNAGKATLFVLKIATTGLPAEPPLVPQSTTGGRSVGYWRSGQLVYVLVVDGDQRSYRGFVSTSGAPFA